MTPIISASSQLADQLLLVYQHENSLMPQTCLAFDKALTSLDQGRPQCIQRSKKHLLESHFQLREAFKEVYQVCNIQTYLVRQTLEQLAFLGCPKEAKSMAFLPQTLKDATNIISRSSGVSNSKELMDSFAEVSKAFATLSLKLYYQVQELQVKIIQQQEHLRLVYDNDFDDWLGNLKPLVDDMLKQIKVDNFANTNLLTQMRTIVFDISSIVTIDLE